MFIHEKLTLENVKKLKNFNDIDVVMSFKKLEEKFYRELKMSEKILFLTGKLAQRQLERILNLQ